MASPPDQCSERSEACDDLSDVIRRRAIASGPRGTDNLLGSGVVGAPDLLSGDLVQTRLGDQLVEERRANLASCHCYHLNRSLLRSGHVHPETSIGYHYC